MESWNPLLWNPGIIEIGFHNHPPDRRRFEFEILELKNLKNSNIGARACLPKILTSLCTLLSHKFGIVHTSTRFRQATMGFSSFLATKPYKNNLVLISVVFITSLCCFWSVLSSFWTLPGRHCADPSTDADVSCVELPMQHTDCLGIWYMCTVGLYWLLRVAIKYD
jgi:hypothetical protein